MRIGDLARAAQTQVETVRYYERAGLLPEAPRGDANNYRLYGPVHVERLAFIRHCRALDMTLAEIRTLLRFRDDPRADCAEVNALLDAHIGHVTTRIRALRQLEKQLKALREHCAGGGDAAHCGILTDLAQAARAAPAAAARGGGAAAHLAGTHAGGRPSARRSKRSAPSR